MVADNFPHRGIGKALFVITEQRRRIYAGENRRLSGRTLRPAFHTERRISGNDDAVVNCGQFFASKYSQRFGIN
jgi:hypothetical protein